MKKLTIILSSLILLISASSFTKDENVSERVKTAFDKTFTSASEVNWKKENGFFMVNFKVDDQNLAAAYNEDGELVGTSRDIPFAQLPLSISLALKNQFQNYSFDVKSTEITYNGETSYYLNAENNKQAIRIKADAFGYLRVVNKTKKK